MLHNDIQTKLRWAAELLTLRTKYLKTAPWCFVKADTIEGAGAFIRSATSRPSNEQDPLTNYLLETYRAALLARADGDVCTESLSKAVSTFDEVPLDDIPGEGYHRGTHHTLLRANAASTVYVKQSTRTKANIKLIRRFLRMGPGGKRVLRYEWRAWKRVLQVRRRALWQPKGRMSRDKVFNRVYRMDQEAEFDWNLYSERVLAPGQGLVPESEATGARQSDGLRIEYLKSVLKTKYYSADVPRAGMDDEGRAIERIERHYFQIMAMTSDRSRPSLMPTNETCDEVSQRARLALCVQEVVVKPVVDAGDQVIVFSNCNLVWKTWRDLGPFASVRNSLTSYQVAVGVDAQPGCIALSNPMVAIPDLPVTDLNCPTLMILDELRRRGWGAVRDVVDHTSTDVGVYEGTEAIRMKAYFIVVLQLDQCLPLTSSIPSNQPIAFYRLLLNGTSVEPGLGNPAYLALLHNRPVAAAALPWGDDEDQREFTTIVQVFVNYMNEAIFSIAICRYARLQSICVWQVEILKSFLV